MKKEATKPPMPEFEPWLPEKLLNENTSPREIYLLEQTSILRQQGRWQAEIIEDMYHNTDKISVTVSELEDFKVDLEYNNRLLESLDAQKKEFKFIKEKWFKIGMYIFFLVVYPIYLATLQEAGWVKTIVNSVGLMTK